MATNYLATRTWKLSDITCFEIDRARDAARRWRGATSAKAENRNLYPWWSGPDHVTIYVRGTGREFKQAAGAAGYVVSKGGAR